MTLFVAIHQHAPERCPAGDPAMGPMLLSHLSAANAAKFGVSIQAEAVANDKHTLYLIADAGDQEQQAVRPGDRRLGRPADQSESHRGQRRRHNSQLAHRVLPLPVSAFEVIARILAQGTHKKLTSRWTTAVVEYMAFEYLVGGTLAEYLRRSSPPALGDILRLGRQLCRGLSHLHGRGLIHRDVSPDNVWLDERHVAHLGDFDSAITTSSSGARRPLTTNAFAAPEEQAGQPLDARSDLY